MPHRLLVVSKNLLGDGLWVGPPLRLWYESHQDWEIDVLTNDDPIQVIYGRMGLSVRVIVSEAELRRPYDQEVVMDPSRAHAIRQKNKGHIVQCYGEMLGVRVPELAKASESYRPTFYVGVGGGREMTDSRVDELPDGVVFLAPFSRSCASQKGEPPNKMLPWVLWQGIIRWLQSRGYEYRILGALNDRTPLPVLEREYASGWPLETVGWAMQKKCRAIIGVDNGIMHVAAAQCLPEVLFYPAVLAKGWIAPLGNPHLALLHLDPARVDVGQLWETLRRVLPSFLERRRFHSSGVVGA